MYIVLPYALRAVLRTFQIAPGDLVEHVLTHSRQNW